MGAKAEAEDWSPDEPDYPKPPPTEERFKIALRKLGEAEYSWQVDYRCSHIMRICQMLLGYGPTVREVCSDPDALARLVEHPDLLTQDRLIQIYFTAAHIRKHLQNQVS